MSWIAPEYSEIKMDAEISSYQEDHDPVRDPQFATPRHEDPASCHGQRAVATVGTTDRR